MARRFLYLCVIAMVVLPFTACSTTNSATGSSTAVLAATNKASEAFSSGDYEQAIYQMQKCLELDISSKLRASALSLIGTSYYYMENYEKARECFLKSIETMPERGYWGYMELSAVNKRLGNFDEAYKCALKAKVRKEVSQKTNSRQTPLFGWLDGEGDFIFENL
jgi:tetratricopeptide (TPR) repeat protein